MRLREFALAFLLAVAIAPAPAFAQGQNFNAIVSSQPPSARNFPGCSVGVASTACLTANTGYQFVQIENVHPTNTVACAWGATPVLNSSNSIQLAPNQAASWGPMTGGIPTGALNCIASGAASPLYVEWK